MRIMVSGHSAERERNDAGEHKEDYAANGNCDSHRHHTDMRRSPLKMVVRARNSRVAAGGRIG